VKLVAEDISYLLKANKAAAEAADEDSSACFEFRALEALLRIVVDTYTQRLHMYSPVVAKLLRDISGGEMDATCLQRLLPLKDNLNSIERSANELLTLVVSLIRSEPDMRGLFLTGRREYLMSLQNRESLTTKLQDNILDSKYRPKQSDKKWRAVPAAPVPSSRVREMIPISTESLRDCELMLEAFERETIQLRAESIALHRRIDAAEHFRLIVRDSNRHNLLRLQTKTSVVSLSVTSGALLTGIFGMNLISNLEVNPFAFPIAASFAIGLPLITHILLRQGKFLRKEKLRPGDMSTLMGSHRNNQLQELWIDLAKLGDVRDALLFVVRERDEADELNHTDIKKIFDDAALQHASDDLLKLIIKVYGDGSTVSVQQLRRLLSEMPSARWGRGLRDRMFVTLPDDGDHEPVNLPAPSFLRRLRSDVLTESSKSSL
jgi:Mg2+ and Co2+ transporter CorA